MAPEDPAGTQSFRTRLIHALEAKVDSILESGRPNGQFGTEPWIVRDQDVILTLAILFKSELSRYQGDRGLLKAIAAGGCYLREKQDDKGMYLFNKKDNSEWGMIYMPWTYLRWMMCYDLVRDNLSEADRKTWEEGLVLGYSGISATELSSASNIYPGPLPFETPPKEGEVIPWIHNIPSHHATGLYLAGRAFGRPDWMEQAVEYMGKVVGYQSEYGWWTEHVGPVVLYNRVYLEALAVFFHYSRNEQVKRALDRGNEFHFNYTYPNGASIETIDERNPYPPVDLREGADGQVDYLPRMMPPNPGLYYSEEGRALLGLLLNQAALRGVTEIDNAEFLLLCLPDEFENPGLEAAPPARFRMGESSLLAREDPWLLSFSAYCAPRTPNRFIQDRQNLISVYHGDTGLIIGGGNTKIQPRWSTMTVGSLDLVSPAGSTRETNLAPETALSYVPDAASIEEVDDSTFKLTVETAGAVLSIRTTIESDRTLQIQATLEKGAPDGRPAAAHFTFIRYPGDTIRFSDGTTAGVDGSAVELTRLESVEHRNWKLKVPGKAIVAWPVLPHNPYEGNGRAQVAEGRLVVSLPFTTAGETLGLRLTVRSD